MAMPFPLRGGAFEAESGAGGGDVTERFVSGRDGDADRPSEPLGGPREPPEAEKGDVMSSMPLRCFKML